MKATKIMKLEKSHKGFECMDCAKDTFYEYYIVYLKLWKKANPKLKGKLCIKCLEKRLKRKLTPKDFTKVLVNRIKDKRTKILEDRLGL